MSRNGIIVFACLILMVGCQTDLFREHKDKVIAEVGNEKLYLTELADNLPHSLNSIDSISYSQTYIEKWVRNQLLLQKAEINIDERTQKDIEYMIENYRISLMVFKYQQMLLKQKLDTIVNHSQIEEYYKMNSGNFRLDSNAVKAIFVQIPKSTYDASKIRRWIRSKKEEDIITLEDYCYQNARNFNMGEEWVYFSSIINKTPKKITDQAAFLKSRRHIEVHDSIYNYYITILDYRLVNDTSPMVFVERHIKDIILNHRKVQFIKDLDNNVYKDAIVQKKFTIFIN